MKKLIQLSFLVLFLLTSCKKQPIEFVVTVPVPQDFGNLSASNQNLTLPIVVPYSQFEETVAQYDISLNEIDQERVSLEGFVLTIIPNSNNKTSSLNLSATIEGATFFSCTYDVSQIGYVYQYKADDRCINKAGLQKVLDKVRAYIDGSSQEDIVINLEGSGFPAGEQFAANVVFEPTFNLVVIKNFTFPDL
ncbi:hypothetical protein V6R21_30035 [Limibacter armeniacum]|uniref:hypothetical protein n=1 Tax=Limibacter armeniacum TaxID=466084 RepID=UPI002FE508DE